MQLNPAEKKRIEECENILDLTNIVIIRQKIQLETERLVKQQATTENKSWLGWMWGGSSKTNLDDSKKGTAIRKSYFLPNNTENMYMYDIGNI